MMAVIGFLMFLLSFLGLAAVIVWVIAVIVAIWLGFAALCMLFGITTLIPTVLIRQKSVPLIVFSIIDILSGILVFVSFIFFIINTVGMSEFAENAETMNEPNTAFAIIIGVFLLLVLAAIFLIIIGAVLSIIRAVKSRKGKIAPRSLDLATHICAGTSSVILFVFSLLTVTPIGI
jgi:hypothetical protein